jgi:uncharacterized protein with HEPN domain
MTENLQIIQTKLVHLERMQANLRYSVSQVAKILPLQDWTLLTPDQHESLAAFRVRFSEFQEHIGKTMRAVAVEEEQDVERFGAVLAFMERLEVLDTVAHWKAIRELRNAVNHDYADDSIRLAEFFDLLMAEVPVLFGYLSRLKDFCANSYFI